MMRIDIDKVVRLALSHRGQGEATGDNDGPYVAKVLGEAKRLSWCAAWVMRMYEWAGYPIAQLGGGDPRLLPFWACRRVSTLLDELRERGCVLGQGDVVQPGDFRLQLGAVRHAGGSGHVDMVTQVLRAPGKRSETIVVGGNVGNMVADSRHLLWTPTVTAYARPARIMGAA